MNARKPIGATFVLFALLAVTSRQVVYDAERVILA